MKKAFGTIREQTVNTERKAVYNTKHRLTTHGSTRVLGAELKDSFFIPVDMWSFVAVCLILHLCAWTVADSSKKVMRNQKLSSLTPVYTQLREILIFLWEACISIISFCFPIT